MILVVVNKLPALFSFSAHNVSAANSMLGFIFGQGPYCLILCLSFELPGDDINFGLQMNWH